ncbi:hypothetical protein HQ865_20030 [Mucilaginibacter mali]|uniref:Uncharacterized protein n=1 Tax=Mucilaginibacter mali TaxID=2740462 RepID=A0A7D4TX21_9SPHI|nr:hypothetical protein [Mucilaginibacter mali]QKJ31955.1 hypothetical protein HQ865_20030 [Mucilaginibacter mali]
MKRPILFALICLLFVACKKKDPGAEIYIDPVIADNYTADAQQLLFRLLQNGSVSTDKDKPQFNQGELNKILANLQAVYNLKTPQSDSAMKMHVYPHISLSGISLQVDKNSTEGQKVLSYTPTDAGFNNLMSKYGFTFYRSLYTPSFGFVAITTNAKYNIPPLLTAFKSFPYIISAEQDGAIGDGNDITYTIMPSGVDIGFAMKSGDCPAGCINSYGWRYHVAANYKVTYLGRF